MGIVWSAALRAGIALFLTPIVAAIPISLVMGVPIMIYTWLLIAIPLEIWAVVTIPILLVWRIFLKRRLSYYACAIMGGIVLAGLDLVPALLRSPHVGETSDSPFEGFTMHHPVLSIEWGWELSRLLMWSAITGAFCGVVFVALKAGFTRSRHND